jgi:hypothetical protein
MKEETREKIKRTKEENSRKVGDFNGYEIWVDSKNFMTIKGGTTHYYSSLYQLFYKINLEVNQRTIKNKDLDTLAETLEKREVKFLADLKDLLCELTFIEPEELVKELK